MGLFTEREPDNENYFIKVVKLRIALTMALLGLIVMTFFYFQQRDELVTLRNGPKIEVYMGGDIRRGMIIDSLQNRCDSLYAENFPCQIQLNRYQIAYELFMERNPKAAKQYGDIISEETE